VVHDLADRRTGRGSDLYEIEPCLLSKVNRLGYREHSKLFSFSPDDSYFARPDSSIDPDLFVLEFLWATTLASTHD